jgi:peptidoglycan L-alanyl-D-glutamate endopeptidase CwlK
VPDASHQHDAPAAGFKLSERSLMRLVGVHPDLVRVVKRAAGLCAVEFIVTEGVRSLERQKQLYAQGRTAPGKKVTWTMHSRHLTGHAVDLVPLAANGTLDWNTRASFVAVGAAMKAAAHLEGVDVRWGYDWDGDGVLQEKGEYDGPHFELPRGTP